MHSFNMEANLQMPAKLLLQLFELLELLICRSSRRIRRRVDGSVSGSHHMGTVMDATVT